jgi:hypothetical protein
MERYETWVAGLLREDGTGPAQDVGTEHIFHGVEYLFVMDQCPSPRQIEVSARQFNSFWLASECSLEFFISDKISADFFIRQHSNRKDITIAFVGFDLLCG